MKTLWIVTLMSLMMTPTLLAEDVWVPASEIVSGNFQTLMDLPPATPQDGTISTRDAIAPMPAYIAPTWADTLRYPSPSIYPQPVQMPQYAAVTPYQQAAVAAWLFGSPRPVAQVAVERPPEPSPTTVSAVPTLAAQGTIAAGIVRSTAPVSTSTEEVSQPPMLTTADLAVHYVRKIAVELVIFGAIVWAWTKRFPSRRKVIDDLETDERLNRYIYEGHGK